MKILHVLNELKPSGGETMLLSAARCWLEQSEHHILSTGESRGPFATQLEEAGYEIHHLPFRKNPQFFSRFTQLISSVNYDVIHIHTERACMWYALAIRIRFRGRIAIVRTVHHIFLFEGFLRLRKLAERHFMRRILNVKFLSNSPSGKANELKRYGMHNDLAPNWYDSDFFVPPTNTQRDSARAEFGLRSSQVVFVSLGGNWEYKNYNLIVQAMALVPPEYDVLYLQVGVQGEGCPLESLAREIGVAHRLRCTGILQNSLPALHAADAYVMPSREEGFGVAAVEAMATGLPAILSNRPALWDFSNTISNIRFIEPQVHDIACAIRLFADMSPADRQALGYRQSLQAKQQYGLSNGPYCYLKAWENGLTSDPPN